MPKRYTSSLQPLLLLASIRPVQRDNKNLHGTLCHMARSIPGTCLLARAQGNEKVLYAIWQKVSQAHAFGQVLGAMRKYFMPYGKKYSRHMPFGKGSGQWGSTLCHMARSIPGTCLLARARGNAKVLHTWCHYACICFKQMPIRSATDTVSYSSQEE